MPDIPVVYFLMISRSVHISVTQRCYVNKLKRTQLHNVCLSVRPREATRLPLDELL